MNNNAKDHDFLLGMKMMEGKETKDSKKLI